MKKTMEKGFTLLELLVVIGIIGIITALATVAYSATQTSGRNSRRKQDLVAVQNALEQYYSLNGFVYPATDCKDASSYLQSAWPVDPSSTTTTTVSYTEACTTTSYCVCAQMEGAGTAGNSGSSNCTWTDGKTYYCVANLQ